MAADFVAPSDPHCARRPHRAAAGEHTDKAREEAARGDPSDRAGDDMTNISSVFIWEIRRIFSLAPVFATIILGSIVYAAYYPQPYVNEALRNVPIAVVDRDHTSASRKFIRAVDAS